MRSYQVLSVVYLLCVSCGPKEVSWARRSLYYKDASLELPGKLVDSYTPSPSSGNPLFKGGHAYHGNFYDLDVYVMDGLLKTKGKPNARDAATWLLRGFTQKHDMKVGQVSYFKSPIGEEGIQIVAPVQMGDKELAISVHSVTRGERQISVRIVWRKDDKAATEMAYRISNSLKFGD